MKVLIVGAGPSGLMMALCLKRYGINAVIIDKKEKITEHSKALGMQARTLEAFYDLGIEDRFLAKGKPMPKISFYKGSALLGSADFSWLETSYPFVLGIPQSETESILEEALRQEGIKVLWNSELVELQEDLDKVETLIVSGSKSLKENYDYVVGCDGIHSVVRESQEIPFIGSKIPENFAIADLEIEGDIDKETIIAIIAEDNSGLVLFFPISKGRTRVVLNNCLLDKKEIPTLEYVKDIVKQRVKQPLVLKNLKWSSIFNVQYKKAKAFSKGRCFLVGDAAHVHSPIGGQGMNTGLQDAYNLAWKLALVMQKKAEATLLTTYDEERNANAKRLLKITHRMTIIGTAHNKLIKLLRPHILHFIFHSKKLSRFLTYRMSQLQINYKNMNLSKNHKGCFISAFGKAFNQAPAAGERMVDLPLSFKNAHEIRLSDVFKGPHFALLIFLSDSENYKDVLEKIDFITNAKYPDLNLILITKKEISKEMKDWSGSVFLDEKGAVHERYGALKSCIYLIRPDKYIGMKVPSLDLKAVEQYLDEIFIEK